MNRVRELIRRIFGITDEERLAALELESRYLSIVSEMRRGEQVEVEK